MVDLRPETAALHQFPLDRLPQPLPFLLAALEVGRGALIYIVPGVRTGFVAEGGDGVAELVLRGAGRRFVFLLGSSGLGRSVDLLLYFSFAEHDLLAEMVDLRAEGDGLEGLLPRELLFLFDFFVVVIEALEYVCSLS